MILQYKWEMIFQHFSQVVRINDDSRENLHTF